MALSDAEKRAALLLGLLFVAAMVAGYVAFAVYSTLAGGGAPSLRIVGLVLAALGLLVLVGGAIYRRQ